MNKFIASTLAVAVTAKSFPYKKDNLYTAVPKDSAGTTAGWWMGLVLNINQDSAKDDLTFAWLTGVYPASNSFVAGSIYQTYVQGAGMALDGSYNNAVCNMAYSATVSAQTFTAANSCGKTMLSTITTKAYTGVSGEDTKCYNPWTSFTGY